MNRICRFCLAENMDLTPQDLCSVNVGYWANYNEIKLGAGIFSFTNHEYEWELLEESPRVVCYMKGTQGGFTEVEILKTLHGMIYKKYPLGVAVLFPTADDVSDFSKSRFGPLIAANHRAIGQFVRGTDMASLKKIHDAFLYLRGARLAQTIGADTDTKESTKLRSIPVDRVVFEEPDLMDKDVIEKAKRRMGHSLVKEEVYISNPTEPNVGIDRIFQQSDQRHWHRKCSCGEFTCAEEEFPQCVKLYPDADERRRQKQPIGFIACKKCSKPIGIWPGQWVAKKPQNKEIRGYRWSQLTSVFNDPAEILRDFENPPQGNLGDVYKLRLGLPWISKEDKLQIQQVLECCNNDYMQTSFSAGQTAMGVDVGKIKHVIIGIRTGNDRYEILKVAQLSSFNDIHDLARKFNVKSCVVDIRPYEDEARQFQKSEPYKVYLCEYCENPMQEAFWNNHDLTVKVYRTGAFDMTHRLISKKFLTIPRESPEIREFAKQLCSSYKKLEMNKKTGTSVYRYRSEDDEDHYRNALNYFYFAASGSRIAKVSQSENKALTADNSYARI